MHALILTLAIVVSPAGSEHFVATLEIVSVRPTPGPTGSSCAWGAVPVLCQRSCSCLEVLARLELAKSELRRWWGSCPADFDAALRGWRIEVAAKPRLTGPADLGLKPGDRDRLGGYAIGSQRRIVLTEDMSAALHELAHVESLDAEGPRDSIYDHPVWERDGALREIDLRYLQRFRGRLP